MKRYIRTFDYGGLEISIRADHISLVAQPGPNDDAVEWLCGKSYISEQTDQWTDRAMRTELSEYGAWEDEELGDRTANVQRLIWLACHDLADEYCL
jgi:hypothetical protein